jgi:hypothetical protein
MSEADRQRSGGERPAQEAQESPMAPATAMEALVDRFGAAGARRFIQRKRAQTEAAPSDPAAGAAQAGAGAPLPAGVRSKMEGSFGADFSDVRVHQGGKAEAIGAHAYAEGANLHFAPGQYDPASARGQELLGHELAHVVQQRSGKVAAPLQAKGAPIVEDASLEGEADAVGARAARGEPAGLPAAGTQIARPAVQGYFKIKREDFEGQKVAAGKDTTFSAQQKPDGQESYLKDDGTANVVRQALAGIAGLRVSGDGTLAMEDAGASTRQAKSFFMAAAMIDGCNANLEKVGSTYRLEAAGGKLKVPDAKGGLHDLVEVIGVNVKDKSKGDTLGGPVNCDEMGGSVAGWQQDANKRLMLKDQSAKDTPKWADEEGHRAAAYVNEYADRKDDYFSKRSGAAKASQYAVPTQGAPIKKTAYTVKVTTDSVDELKKVFIALKINWNAVEVKGTEVTGTISAEQREALTAKKDEVGAHVSQVVTVADVPYEEGSGAPGLAAALAGQRDAIAEKYATMPGDKKDEVAARLGVNQFAAPKVGDAFATFSTGAKRDEDGKPNAGGAVTDFESGEKIKAKWGQHWGGVVAKSGDGADYVTLENYDRQAEDAGNAAAGKVAAEGRAFFGMYGSEVGTTWHDAMKGSKEFPNAITVAYQNKDRK